MEPVRKGSGLALRLQVPGSGRRSDRNAVLYCVRSPGQLYKRTCALAHALCPERCACLPSRETLLADMKEAAFGHVAFDCGVMDESASSSARTEQTPQMEEESYIQGGGRPKRPTIGIEREGERERDEKKRKEKISRPWSPWFCPGSQHLGAGCRSTTEGAAVPQQNEVQAALQSERLRRGNLHESWHTCEREEAEP